MGFLTTGAIWIGAALGAVAVKVLADEFKDWSPRIAQVLLRAAVRRAPADLQERWSEEWAAHLNDTPGALGKIFLALGFNFAAAEASGSHRTLLIRQLDLHVSAYSLFVFGPIFLVVAACIKAEGSGSVFVRRKVYGRNLVPFYVLKFRTTRATDLGDEVTKVGRFLRRTSLDELPQMINVFRGEMSIVGRRALGKQTVMLLRDSPPKLQELAEVKPGLTGPAQIHPSTDPEILLERELDYAQNKSLWTDIKIIVRTIPAVLLNRSS
jgi:lipopolysaccharide/colanic/teichoic acid biosynthesis glycosyltransferase